MPPWSPITNRVIGVLSEMPTAEPAARPACPWGSGWIPTLGWRACWSCSAAVTSDESPTRLGMTILSALGIPGSASMPPHPRGCVRPSRRLRVRGRPPDRGNPIRARYPTRETRHGDLRNPRPDIQLAHVGQLDRLRASCDERADLIEHLGPTLIRQVGDEAGGGNARHPALAVKQLDMRKHGLLK